MLQIRDAAPNGVSLNSAGETRSLATFDRFTFFEKFELRLTSTSTFPPPQLQLPQSAVVAMPRPKESAAVPNT